MELASLLHSISYAGLWGQQTLTAEQTVDKAADLGFDGILLAAKRPHVSVLDYGAKERTELRRRIERRHLAVMAIAGYNNFTAGLEHGEVPRFEMEVHYIVELARMAHDLGGSLVRIFTGYQHPSIPYPQQWTLLVKGIRECSRRAAEFGVTIGVQNHHDLAVGFESQYDLVREVNEPNCKALFDAWAPALHGADLSAGARLLGAMTAHTTVANYRRRPQYRYHPDLVNYTVETPLVQAASMRDGFIDYMRFWSEMYGAGFRGSVAYEMCAPLEGGGSMENLDAHAGIFLEMFHEFRAGVADYNAEKTEAANR